MAENDRTIQVSGRGEVSAPPDLGHIRLGVRVTNRDPDAALNLSNERISGVQRALRAAGVAGDDVTLGRFSIDEVYDHVDGRRIHRGYRISHDLSITVRDIDRTGEILSIGVNAGADDVGGVRFSVENPAPHTDRARELAYANAFHKAEELARLSGVSLGGVVSMRETTYEPVEVERYEARSMMVMEARSMSAPVPINPADSEFSVAVEIAWEIA